MSLDILYTEGNGELLLKIFRALSSVLYDGGVFKSLMKLALFVGGFFFICIAFLRQKFEPLFKSFLLPGLIIWAVLFVPTMNLKIQEAGEKTESAKEVKVPYFLGKSIVVLNRAAHFLTGLLEVDSSYRWISHLNSEEHLFVPKKFYFKDRNLEENFHEFCRECVFRDLGMGLYDKKELTESDNLFDLFEKKTSNLRTMQFRESNDLSLISCKEAMEKMKGPFEEEVKERGLDDGEKGMMRRFFNNTKKEEEGIEKFIKQRMLIEVLKEELSKKGKIDQSSSYFSVSTLIALRNFLEVLLYLTFPMAILFALLSFGIRILLHWFKLVFWVSLWPIFYSVVNLFLNSLWKVKTKGLLMTLNHADRFLEISKFMENCAVIFLISIPVLFWVLLKGGVSRIKGHEK